MFLKHISITIERWKKQNSYVRCVFLINLLSWPIWAKNHKIIIISSLLNLGAPFQFFYVSFVLFVSCWFKLESTICLYLPWISISICWLFPLGGKIHVFGCDKINDIILLHAFHFVSLKLYILLKLFRLRLHLPKSIFKCWISIILQVWKFFKFLKKYS